LSESSTLITSYAPARSSGTGLRTCGVIDALARHGPVTVAYVPFDGEEPASDLLENPRITLRPIVPSRGPGRALAALRALARGAPWSLAKAASAEAVAVAERAEAHERVIADGPTMATALLGLAARRPLTYLSHNVESSFRGTWVLRRFERRILRTFATSWMASRPDVARARDLAGPHATTPAGAQIDVVYVPNVIDVAALGPCAAHRGGERILFVADFTYLPNRNGLAFLLDEVMPLVWERLPEAHLLLVGRGVNRAPEDRRVEVLGFVEHLGDAYAQADCAAVPLLQGGGSPLKFIEAMAHGLPVVATPRAAAGLEVRADEHFLQADGAEPFAQALVQALSGGAGDLGARARALVESSYSIEALAEILAPVASQAEDASKAEGASKLRTPQS
jgi:glycosyltransferase involved in cell wall biosynthesis